MKTIDELVGEIAKNIGAANSKTMPPKKTVRDAVKPAKRENSQGCFAADKNLHKCDRLTLDAAKEIARAAEIASDILGVKTVTAIRDEGANLVLLHAMDNSYIASVQVAQDKAYTAAALKMPTHKALEESRGGALDGLTNGNGIMLLGGGFPLKIKDKIYGGVGVSGGTKEQDTLIAAVAAAIFEIRFA